MPQWNMDRNLAGIKAVTDVLLVSILNRIMSEKKLTPGNPLEVPSMPIDTSRCWVEARICWLLLFLLFISVYGRAQDAHEIVAKANELLRAKSSYCEIGMEVIKPDWSRKFAMKVWSLEPDYALVLITAPARDKGTVTLKRQKEVWNWIPSVQRVIKIPPSMMLQPWMGSDFTNDDLVRQSSIVEDYTQEIIGNETLENRDCYKIQLNPKPEAGVVWGKIVSWISQKGYLELRSDYFDEDGQLVKTMVSSAVKELGGRVIPTHWEMIPTDKPNQKTVMDYRSISFNIKTEPSFFSEQNMKRVR
jgi:outer membrane lipoprotein-sorting protein